ncbi:reverse transcriptase zinc-binding domain-containing protein [Tanacetum coccineum]
MASLQLKTGLTSSLTTTRPVAPKGLSGSPLRAFPSSKRSSSTIVAVQSEKHNQRSSRQSMVTQSKSEVLETPVTIKPIDCIVPAQTCQDHRTAENPLLRGVEDRSEPSIAPAVDLRPEEDGARPSFKQLRLGQVLLLVDSSFVGTLGVTWAIFFCEMKRGKAKVAWDVVCLPMKEGGLGIRRLEMFNVALISSHIWSIITDKESLWVKWIHSYKLKRRSLWDIPFRGNMSWGWRNFLKIRNLVKPFIWSRIGNGQRTSAWYDNWSPLGQLSNVISNRDIYSAGFKLDMRVSDIIKDGMWAWPTDWLIKYPMISNMNAPVLTGSDDYIVLRNHSNMDVRFSVATIWDCIRPRNAEVNWFHIVWFSQRIPRHAIHLWLVVNRKLKTQDLLRQWDVKNSGITMFNCPLCEGRRFGFVRFIKNPDQANLLEDLNKIWIGSHHLFASIARFDRKQNSQLNQSYQKQSNNTKPHETGHASHTTGGRSYASVLNGKEGTQKPVLAGPITKNITLENSDLLELSDTSSVILAKDTIEDNCGSNSIRHVSMEVNIQKLQMILGIVSPFYAPGIMNNKYAKSLVLRGLIMLVLLITEKLDLKNAGAIGESQMENSRVVLSSRN